jgi:ubiquinone/menaquinone biosynthesis C-methylase UbiE
MSKQDSPFTHLRLDRFVHSRPGLYQWKIDAIRIAKRAVYKVTFMDARILRLRTEIEQRNDEIIDRHIAGRKVLEVGCGQGTFLSWLSQQKKCDCTGIDISEEMVRSARAKNSGPEYRVMDSADLQFADGEFDVVVFSYVLHHLPDWRKTISEAKRVGKVIVIYECCAWESQPFRCLSQAYWKFTDGGYTYLTLDEWQARFALPVVDEIRGHGLVRYGMCVFKA